MAYDTALAEKVRAYLTGITGLVLEEKKMFGGLAFLVNGKMCINVSDNNLMCRFDPDTLPTISKRPGYHPVVMKGKSLPGYCYVSPDGYNRPADFAYWLECCLSFNDRAKVSRRHR
ncbi:TfoX/Sxy family protein [Parapedobacter lycopersici]|uniref:TfoX/Sxy family protein n=1 Tax=Parapedobacter lycopersici TaxID=1864939 RepID=UPI00333E2E54